MGFTDALADLIFIPILFLILVPYMILLVNLFGRIRSKERIRRVVQWLILLTLLLAWVIFKLITREHYPPS